MAAIATLTNSLAALPNAKRGLLAWNPALRQAAAELSRELADVAPEALALALRCAIERRLGNVIDGIERYRAHPYRRDMAEPPLAWRDGSTVLFDYGTRGGPGAPVLFIPSLINRGYILDLSPRRSLIRYLGARGLRPFLLDWGAPGPAERDFGLSDYVMRRAVPALQQASRLAGRPVAVIGYCMGGNLALATVLARPDRVSALALLATPWDFHAGYEAITPLVRASRNLLASYLGALDHLPVDALQAFFLALDPGLSARKFASFAQLDPVSDEARDFVALEDWVNDGVPLTAKVAQECLAGWYDENLPARGEWRIDGRPVRPDMLRPPALVVVPDADRIVPPASALALARAIPDALVLEPRAGHIGMMVGSRAEAGLWRPLADWLRSTDRVRSAEAQL